MDNRRHLAATTMNVELHHDTPRTHVGSMSIAGWSGDRLNTSWSFR